MQRLGVKFAGAVLLAIFVVPANGISPTLGATKQKYLSQKVVLVGPVKDRDSALPEFLSWYLAREQAGRFMQDWKTPLAGMYRAKTATVVAIQLDSEPSFREKTNALGEMINQDEIPNPYLDFVVRFDDGTLAMATAHPSTIEDEVRLSSVQNAINEEMAVGLPKLVGSDLYASGFTRLYEPDSALDELLGDHPTLKEIVEVPLLVPLTIMTAKYDAVEDLLILKLRLPGDHFALAATQGSQLIDRGEPLLERVSGSLLARIPNGLTAREIAAIRKNSIFRGMSRRALEYSMGSPKSENNWGRAGRQLIYSDSFTVYLDTQKRVVDWQSLRER